jgi:hypothetical protein
MLVPVVPRFATVSIGSCLDILDINAPLVMQVAEQLRERGKGLPNVFSLLGLGVGFVPDFDIEVDATLPLFRQSPSSNDPIFRIDVLDGD